jgi:hypothetical protein
MDDTLKGPHIRFRYDQQDKRGPAYVNGVYGGVTPYREILANFYMERPETPAAEIRRLNSDGTLGPQVAEAAPGLEGEPGAKGGEGAGAAWVRDIQCGIVLSLDNAKSIHAWLGEQIRILEGLAAAQASREEMKQ